MRAFIIGTPAETKQAHASAKAAGIDATIFQPAPADEAMDTLERFGLRWTYPLHGVATLYGLRCHAYKTRDHRARVSCFCAHYSLWTLAALSGEVVLVMESDCIWTRPWEPPGAENAESFGIVSFNDPRGATRKAAAYHEYLQECARDRIAIAHAPWVDDDLTIPQGLPGMSCYAIHPEFAADVLNLVQERGAWPNDAIVCRQFFGDELGCVTRYYTRVSGRPSTLA